MLCLCAGSAGVLSMTHLLRWRGEHVAAVRLAGKPLSVLKCQQDRVASHHPLFENPLDKFIA
jgi:hypothetical protein